MRPGAGERTELPDDERRFLILFLYRHQAKVLSLLEHEGIGLFMVIFYFTVEDCFLDVILDHTNRFGRGYAESLHYFFTGNRGLEIPDGIFLLQIRDLLPYDPEIFHMPPDGLLVLGRDVGLTQQHQVIQVISGIENKPPDGRIAYSIRR